jgi:hypothetical protein
MDYDWPTILHNAVPNRALLVFSRFKLIGPNGAASPRNLRSKVCKFAKPGTKGSDSRVCVGCISTLEILMRAARVPEKEVLAGVKT